MDFNKREIPLCEVCQKPANQTCGACKLVYYCSRAHQKLGWREGHKIRCCAFKVQCSDTLGRHMVATRDISQGEMILKEKPAIYGPKMSCPAQCLGCNKVLEPILSDNGYDFYKCSSCGWPMCGPDCEKSPIHLPECELMVDRKYTASIKYEQKNKHEPAYCVIAPLRVLLMKDKNPLQFENIVSLESHVEEKVNTSLYVVLKANLVTFLIQVLGLQVDEETIMKIASIFETNAFEVTSPDRSKNMKAIYVTASMMIHSCKPNTKHIYSGDDYTFSLIATVPISKGELITTTYTQTLWGTLDRRKHLRATKCIHCNCDRCKDPTEFGTYIGSIYCSMCNGPGLNGPMMVSTNTSDEGADWKCEKCDHSILSKQMFWGNNALKDELNKLNKNTPKPVEDFIERYNQTLHPTNHLMIQAKTVLIQLYGNIRGYILSELPDYLLKRKIDLCHELLEVADKLDPGLSKFRGFLLLELQSAMTVQIKRDYETEKLTKEAAQDQLMESIKLLQEATNILKPEPNMAEALERKLQEMAAELENGNGDIEQEESQSLSVD